MAGQIRIDSSAFSDTWLTQKMVISNLENLSNKEQSTFKSMIAAWKGSSANTFQACAKELTQETMCALFMLTAISNQTHSTQTVFENTDTDMAASMQKRQAAKGK